MTHDSVATIDNIADLPVGRAPAPLPLPHFPDALHAIVWRNWDVVDLDLLAEVLQATPAQITEIAESMGLPPKRAISPQERRRNYMTVLRRNWHLMPYEQLCPLLGWTAAQMQFFLNEDDFMWGKLGSYKPQAPRVYYEVPTSETQAKALEIGRIVREEMEDVLHAPSEPLFGFINRFDDAPQDTNGAPKSSDYFNLVYPYFLRYGDPLSGEGIDDIPEGYLAALAASGVNAIWIQGVLNTLAPWDFAPELSGGWQERLANLNRLIERCRQFGIDVFLYLNEPRAMPRSFFEKYPELRGIDETPGRADWSPDVVALCTSTPEVQQFLVNAVRHVCEHAPNLGGIVCITYSENLTNCHSRDDDQNAEGAAGRCPRCALRTPSEVNAEVCTLLERGMRLAGSDGKFVLYTWNTPVEWFPELVAKLPKSTWLLCISEWGKVFTRGDYTGSVNEYSISIVGPSEECLRKWKIGKSHGLKTAAKMQAANTYEFSSIPYIPALRLVAQHLENVTQAGIESTMLGWTAGGSPSPNLDLVAEFARSPRAGVREAMLAVATRRFGEAVAYGVVLAWNLMSDAYEEFPFDISVCYAGPQSLGPANLLFAEPTGFKATMCTFPFDDLKTWRGPYSEATLQSQFEKVAEMWREGVEVLDSLRTTHPSPAMEDEWRIAEAARIHFRSTANQIRFIRQRDGEGTLDAEILKDEMALTIRLIGLVAQDSRIGFEATNQYGYTRFDLAEKILNCHYLLRQSS